MHPAFLLYQQDELEMYYAPFDSINRSASIAIVGITPGWQQMEICYRTARAELVRGADETDACRKAKAQASFAGPMRRNLLSMLADLDIHNLLDISNVSLLFGDGASLLHATSAIRYPVFVRGGNFTGYNPNPLHHPLLREMVFEVLAPELDEVSEALVVPLGKTVDTCLSALISAGLLSSDRCLLGFPHPSGGNGHRKSQFERNRDKLRTKAARGLAGDEAPS